MDLHIFMGWMVRLYDQDWRIGNKEVCERRYIDGSLTVDTEEEDNCILCKYFP